MSTKQERIFQTPPTLSKHFSHFSPVNLLSLSLYLSLLFSPSLFSLFLYAFLSCFRCILSLSSPLNPYFSPRFYLYFSFSLSVPFSLPLSLFLFISSSFLLVLGPCLHSVFPSIISRLHFTLNPWSCQKTAVPSQHWTDKIN